MKILELLEDNSGGLSCTRLVYLIWMFGILGVWMYSSIHNKKIEALNNDLIVLIGILTTGKVVQRFGEKEVTT